MKKINFYYKKTSKKSRGFILVELIVVLVILAILIALLIPALTGYIEKAKEKKAATEARQFSVAAKAGFAEWYGSPDSHQPPKGTNNDEVYKVELINSMKELMYKECGMNPTKEPRKGSDRYWVVTSAFKKATWDEWCTKAKNNRGKNRAAFFVKSVNSKYQKVVAVEYLSQDGQYCVRMIFDRDVNGCDFTDEDMGVFVQKLDL